MVEIWIIVAAGAGLILGAAVGYLVAERRCAAGVEGEHRQVAELSARLEAAREAVAERDAGLERLRMEAEGFRERAGEAQLRAERLEAQLEKETQNLWEQKRMLADAEVRLKDAFAGVSQEALAKNNAAFLDLAKSRFDPMKTLLEQYQNRLAEMEQSRTRSHSDLREQLGSVAEAHRALSTQTSQLVTALSNPGTRGRWGEIGLERVLKLSGMTAGIHYDAQLTFTGEDGRSRPDVRVNLPGGKCIVIDSKYPGTHFFKALECENAA